MKYLLALVLALTVPLAATKYVCRYTWYPIEDARNKKAPEKRLILVEFIPKKRFGIWLKKKEEYTFKYYDSNRTKDGTPVDIYRNYANSPTAVFHFDEAMSFWFVIGEKALYLEIIDVYIDEIGI